MRKIAEVVVTGILVVSAAAIAGTVVHRSYFPSVEPYRNEQGLEYTENWKDGLPIGQLVAGTPEAPITIMTLVDLECPACRGFHPIVHDLVMEDPEQVQLLYVHYPLSYHRFALPAARAADCAANEGAFPNWVDAVFEKQDSLGLKSWGSYAMQAGIADTAGIAACAKGTDPVDTIDRGLEFASSLGQVGTPTVLVNGWRFLRTPSEADLRAAIDALLEGEDPR